MADSSELEGIRQLLADVVTHLEKLTTEIQELRSLKNVAREHRRKEAESGELLVQEVRSLRGLANTVLGRTDAQGGKAS